MRIEDYLAAQRKVVDEHLERLLPSPEMPPETLHQAMRYSVFAGGKRLRPILSLAVGKALGGEFGEIIQLACCLELVHTFSLIHDDLPAMDDDDLRRGMPTLHKQFNEAIAILAGDALLNRGIQILARPSPSPLHAANRLKTVHLVCEALGTRGGMIAGQAADLSTEGKPYSAEDLDFIHRSKTGALITAAVVGAAVLSNAPGQAVEHLTDYGRKLGLAFQIVDDILDVVSKSEVLGKTPGKDRQALKATYPQLHGLEESRRRVEALIEEAVSELGFLGTRGEILVGLAHFVSSRRF